MPRILILHASVGSGHKRAAEALAAEFTRRQPGEVRVEDALDYAPGPFRRGYARSYLRLSTDVPAIWGMFYEAADRDPDVAELINNIRRMVEGVSVLGLRKLIESFAPAVIVCTHFLPIELLLQLKRNGELMVPVYCVVTDYTAHTFWVQPNLDGYFVGNQETAEGFTRRDVPATQIMVTGIPVDPAIAEPKDARTIRLRHELPLDEPVVTLFGGGVADRRVRAIVEGLLASDARGTLVLVAGRNETLLGSLRDLPDSETLHLRALGYVTYVDDLVAASDLVITKAGGLIVSEVLARGVPLLVIDPIPGQEEWNADYVVSNGAGIQLRLPESVPGTVRRLLDHPERLAMMRACATELGRPNAAHQIVSRVLEDLTLKRHG